MYKKDRENLNKDNLRLRKAMQELVNQNNMLKRQVNILEQHEDVSNDQRADTIKEQLDYEVERLKRELFNETEKNKKWEQYSNELKMGKQKAESEKNAVMSELQKLRDQVKELTSKNGQLENECEQIRGKWRICEEELKVLRNTSATKPIEPKKTDSSFEYNKQRQENVPRQPKQPEFEEKIELRESFSNQGRDYDEGEEGQFVEQPKQTQSVQPPNQRITNSSRPQNASQLFSSNYQQDYTEQFAGPSDWTQEGTTAEYEDTYDDTQDETKEENSPNRSTSSHHSTQPQAPTTSPPQRPQLNIATEAEDFFANFNQSAFQNPPLSQRMPQAPTSQPPMPQPTTTPP